MKAEKYLGDGVYANFDGYHVWIWTSDGYRQSEPIALESAVFYSLENFFRASWRGTREDPMPDGDMEGSAIGDHLRESM